MVLIKITIQVYHIIVVSHVKTTYAWIQIILILTGLVGNSLILYILTRPKLLKQSTFRYFLVNEVIDMIVVALMLAWLLMTSLFWKIWEYGNIGYTCYNIYPCVNAMNSIGRLLWIKYSRRFGFSKRIKFQVAVISSIILISLIYNSPFLFAIY